jgi:hypothetical protein
MKPTAKNSFMIRARESLSAANKEEMYQLLLRHFDGLTPARFEQDLAEKNWVVLVHRGGRLVGFTTMLVYESTFENQPVTAVYSGDTIVAPEAWGSSALARGWITAVNQLRARYPRGKYYWLLLTSGFRTYRFLPVFWRQFYPRHDSATPGEMRRLCDHLALERFGEQYDSRGGLVRFSHPQRLLGSLKSIPEERSADPHVAFFLVRNPGHSLGDELVCLTELCPENMTAAGRRMAAPQSCESLGAYC